MGIISYIISLAVVGLVIGALGRLVVPGKNPITIGMIMLIGVAGAVLGAIIGATLGLGFVTIIVEVAISAGPVYLMGGRSNNRQLPRARWR